MPGAVLTFYQCLFDIVTPLLSLTPPAFYFEKLQTFGEAEPSVIGSLCLRGAPSTMGDPAGHARMQALPTMAVIRAQEGPPTPGGGSALAAGGPVAVAPRGFALLGSCLTLGVFLDRVSLDARWDAYCDHLSQAGVSLATG